MKFPLAPALALGACAVTDRYDKSLGGYLGAPESALIAAWGPPASVDEMGETRYLSYRRNHSTYIPAATTTYQPICSPSVCVPLGGAKGFLQNEQCTTTFAVTDGKVAGWRWERKACGA